MKRHKTIAAWTCAAMMVGCASLFVLACWGFGLLSVDSRDAGKAVEEQHAGRSALWAIVMAIVLCGLAGAIMVSQLSPGRGRQRYPLKLAAVLLANLTI